MQQNYECQIADHEELYIVSICFKCQGELCCQICEKQLHDSHSDQLVNIQYLLHFIKIFSEIETFPFFKVNQHQLISNKFLNQLNDLQNLFNHQIEQMSFPNLQNICQNMINRYTIKQDGVLRFDNEKLEVLAIDILKHFKAKNCKISEDYFFSPSMDIYLITQIWSKIKVTRKIIEECSLNQHNSGYYLDQILIGHEKRVYTVGLCQRRNILASGSEDNTLKLWSLENNTLIKTYYHSGEVYNIALSNQGNLLAYCGAGENSIYLFDISDLTQDTIVTQLQGHTSYIGQLKFSNDCNYLISGSEDRSVRIWNIQMKQEAFQITTESTIHGIAVNNTLIAANSFNGKIKIWSLQNQKLLCSKKAHLRNFGYDVAFQNIQKMLVSSGEPHVIKLWNLIKLNQGKLILVRIFKIDKKIVNILDFSLCSNFIIAISQRMIEVIDLSTSAVINCFTSNSSSEYLEGLAVTKDRQIAVFGDNHSILVFKK